MRLIIILILTSNFALGQTFNNDTTLSAGIYNAAGKVMFINAKISGTVTITNAIIVAPTFLNIFDTTVSIGSGCQIREFSSAWYGAKSSNSDNYVYLQKSIDQCKGRFPLFIAASYTYSTPLLIAQGSNFPYSQTSLEMYGTASFWDNGNGTKLNYTGNGYALGLILNKGSKIHDLVVSGGFIPPSGTDSVFYNLSFANFKNQGSTGFGAGIWIDPQANYSYRSGSTGCQFYNLKISGFDTLICIGNSIVQNGEIQIFKNIQFGNGIVGFQSSQPQEKGNLIDGIYSWGTIHTLFMGAPNGGNYYITNANIAGHCIRPFCLTQGGFFTSHISNIYAENIGQFGSITSTLLPISISNSVFDFISLSKVGKISLVNTNNNLIKFDNCTFRYYGESGPLLFSSSSTFENCLFSGPVTGAVGSLFINYLNGAINNNGAQVYQTITVDTIRQSPSVKISLRSN